jgi:hypothetical protein
LLIHPPQDLLFYVDRNTTAPQVKKFQDVLKQPATTTRSKRLSVSLGSRLTSKRPQHFIVCSGEGLYQQHLAIT